MIPSTRMIASSLLRTSKSTALRTKAQRWSNPFPFSTVPVIRAVRMQDGWQSQSSAEENGISRTYAFEDIKNLISKPSKDRILIDTREPSELHDTGRIPTALNIPITSQPDSFFISEEEFEDRFGFERPPKNKEVIFYCRAGVRSRAAAQLARQAGWEKTGEYAGSWLDWAGKGGDVER